MTENQPEGGMVNKAYGMIKGAGHSFKRATLGDIYTLIEERADEARQHREENFRYLNNKIDSLGQRLDARIDAVDQKIDNLAERMDSRMDSRMDALDKKIDTHTGQLRQEMNSRMDSLDRKIDQVNKRLDGIMQILVDLSKQRN